MLLKQISAVCCTCVDAGNAVVLAFQEMPILCLARFQVPSSISAYSTLLLLLLPGCFSWVSLGCSLCL
jgi:hypothetical protein